jgi:two-component system, NtrC family, response regulator GlrR
LNQPSKRKARILVVDDDPGLLRLLTIRLRAESYDVEAVESAAQAIAASSRFRPDLVITDLRMDNMDGIGLLKELQNRWPGLKVIILTAHGTIPDAVQATQMGAFGFLTKPVDKQELLDQVQKALRISGFGASDEDWRAEIVTRSAAMEEKLAQAHMVAGTDARVLITGESGTGKELLARALHRLSGRAHKPFIAINCAAIPDTLLESELFGYEKGAFTGAAKRTAGKLESADGGTVFLDEIGEIPPSLQAKLLRVVQDRTVERIGGRVPLVLDLRIVCATNRPLESMLGQGGGFRDDLYYRISEVTIRIPPLRERQGDSLLVAQFLLQQIAERFGKPSRGLAPDAIRAIQAYRWPGNVRELENRIKAAVIMAEGVVVTASDLGLEDPGDDPEYLNLRVARQRAEAQAVRQSLAVAKGNLSRAAELLGVTRPTLYDLLGKHSIDATQFGRNAPGMPGPVAPGAAHPAEEGGSIP